MTDASATLCTENAVSESSFAALVDDLITGLRAGERIDIDRIAADYPEFAARLQEILPSLRAVCDLTGRGGNGNNADGAFDHAALLAGVLGEYRILRQIGRGGMGIVYEAVQTSLNRRVALKVLPLAAMLDPRHLQRFKNEAMAAASLDHPNIVSVYAVGCERGVHFYAMRYVEGQTLAAVIDGLKCGVRNAECGMPESTPNDDLPDTPNSELPTPNSGDTVAAALSTLRTEKPREFFRTVAELGIQAAEALDHAHQLGIVHRDIKPSNLMVESSHLPGAPGRDAALLNPEPRTLIPAKLYITDFGLARIASEPGVAGLTMTGDLLGTLRYMSPEQAEGKSAVLDHRADIYSLGITVYELVTLRPAFPADDRQTLLRQIASEEPMAPRRLNASIPADLETILLKSIAKVPRDRYATARQLADDLRRFVKGQPISARRPSFLDRTRRWGRRHVAAVMSLVIVLAVSLTVLGVALALIFAEQQKTSDALDKRNSALGQAQANLDVAVEAVDKLYMNFAVEWMASETAPTNLQEQFLQQAADFYRRIAQSPGESPQDRFMQASAYQHIGELEKYLENYEEALPPLEQSLEIGRQLGEEFPAEVAYREALPLTLFNLGVVCRELNDLDSAHNAYREALDLLAALPANQTNSERQIACQLEYAHVKQRRGKLDEALGIVQEVQDQLSKQSKVNDYLPLPLITCRYRRASIFIDQNRLSEAQRENEQALGQCQGMRKLVYQDARSLLQDEINLVAQAGDIASRNGRLDEAITQFRASLELQRQALHAKRTPDDFIRAKLAREVKTEVQAGPFCRYVEIQLLLADALRRAGRPYEAELELGKCEFAARVLTTVVRPHVLRYRVAHANVWAMTAQLLSADRADEAHAARRIAARLWLDALEEFSHARTYSSGVHDRQSDLDWFNEAWPGDLAENAATHKEVKNAWHEVLFVRHADATAGFRRENWPAALRCFPLAARLRKKDSAYDWLYIAMSHAHLGEHEKAKDWYDKSAEVIEESEQPSPELIELRDAAKRLLEEKRNAAAAL